MSYHLWGDDWEHWNDLYKAETWIRKYVKRHSLCRIISKEKYGSIRFEYLLPPYTSLMRRSFGIYAPWKKTTRWGSYRPCLWCWEQSLVNRLWCKLGWWTTKRAVLKAVKKWPYLKDELLSDIASDEKLMGKKIHDQYWTRLSNKVDDDE